MRQMTDKKVDHKIKQYQDIINITSKLMCGKFAMVLDRSGYTHDDISNLSLLYAHYFFNLYVDKMPKKTEKDVRNGLITFIKQRLWYLFNISNKQSQNFHLHTWISGYYAKTTNSIEISEDMHNFDPTNFGYRKVSDKEYSILKKNKQNGVIRDNDGFEVVKLGYLDMVTENEYSSIFYNNLDRSLSVEEQAVDRQYKEDIEDTNEMIDNFMNQPVDKKIDLLDRIIDNTNDMNKKTQAKSLKRMLVRELKNARNSK
jgi:hypothetical protein